MRPHLLWTGAMVLIVAMTLRVAIAGDWSVVVGVVVGLVLIVASFGPEGEHDAKPH